MEFLAPYQAGGTKAGLLPWDVGAALGGTSQPDHLCLPKLVLVYHFYLTHILVSPNSLLSGPLFLIRFYFTLHTLSPALGHVSSAPLDALDPLPSSCPSKKVGLNNSSNLMHGT